MSCDDCSGFNQWCTLFLILPNKANDIDGEAIIMLLDDVAEFSYVIPKSGSRLKIKKTFKQFSNNADHFVLTELPFGETDLEV